MPTSILTTKLFIPPPRPQVVLRSRLIERLNKGLHHKLTIISAPAGFGKTTLVSEWIACCGRATAWLSLDKEDNDIARFMNYLIVAIQTLAPNVGSDALGLLQNSQIPPVEAILTNLLNEISAFENPFTLVLDDYHEIDSNPIDQAITFLLEHQPALMHLVITTREDPNLPLTRLRVRDQLTEIRTAELRVTPTEASEFLNKTMGLNLSEENVSALEARTEGWIAGLQLAALSMQGVKDVSGFIQTFGGDHRYIVDYLVEEVLQSQPESIRSFLLQTSILNRLNGSLTDSITGQSGGKEQLEALQRGNFFLIPLDDNRHWYRYHHLFADVLQMHLITERPEQVSSLHKRASEWYEQNGSISDAITHALAARDYTHTADLLEKNIRELLRRRQEGNVLFWLKAIPEELIQNRPVLCNGYAGALLTFGKMDAVDYWLTAAEKWLDETAYTKEKQKYAAEKKIVVNEDEFRRLPGAIALHRAGQALMLGNVDDTMKFAQRVLDLTSADDDLGRGGATAILGLANWSKGDIKSAINSYAESMEKLVKAGNISDAIGCSLALADMQITLGRLVEAMSTFQYGLQLASENSTNVLRGASDMHVGMSELHFERNEIINAIQHLERSKELGEHMGLPQNPYRWRVAMARIFQAKGDLDSALNLLNEAERLYTGDFSPNVRPISALKTRLNIAQGRLGEALSWSQAQALSVDDNLSYLREFEYITLARVLLARFESDCKESWLLEAIGLLERLLVAAQKGERIGSAIEILIVQAIAFQSLGQIHTAILSLQQALALAEPQGYVRIFLGEGPSLRQLLLKLAEKGTMPDYTGKLLYAFETEGFGVMGEKYLSDPGNLLPASGKLIEPLSQRELEVLRLFKTELSGPEIAQQLVISLSTVRTHTKSIYSKLNVNNRRIAVKRAVELNLI